MINITFGVPHGQEPLYQFKFKGRRPSRNPTWKYGIGYPLYKAILILLLVVLITKPTAPPFCLGGKAL
jgi:hypothetical protein